MVATILIYVVAVLHLYFLVLEMFFWTKPLGLKAFGNTIEKAKLTAVLAANQGLYNGFLAAGLLWSRWHPSEVAGQEIAFFFLTCVNLAALYGAYSVSKKILFIQGLPSAVALLFLVAKMQLGN